ncbi:hypothetical protein CJ195_09510 [Bacillus sp. UMB0899]|nr:hypothetical protein CJ195_09510 [Bacillus sp. UMB0899]
MLYLNYCLFSFLYHVTLLYFRSLQRQTNNLNGIEEKLDRIIELLEKDKNN